MTKDEIVVALRCCVKGVLAECRKCPLYHELNCRPVINAAAADLIENQQHHIEALMQDNAALRDTILRRDAQIAAKDVEVVPCKDCKHYLIADEFEGGRRCTCEVNHFSYINNDGDKHFCSYGERKTQKQQTTGEPVK